MAIFPGTILASLSTVVPESTHWTWRHQQAQCPCSRTGCRWLQWAWFRHETYFNQSEKNVLESVILSYYDPFCINIKMKRALPWWGIVWHVGGRGIIILRFRNICSHLASGPFVHQLPVHVLVWLHTAAKSATFLIRHLLEIQYSTQTRHIICKTLMFIIVDINESIMSRKKRRQS